jgi:hypothetical protein
MVREAFTIDIVLGSKSGDQQVDVGLRGRVRTISLCL